MKKIQGLHLKCPIEQHEFLELACVNKLCKANRVYCHQCLKNGDHVAHQKDQKNLIELIEFFHKIEQESENLISKLCSMVEEIRELFIELNQELRKTFQFSKERLQQLNAKQLNQALDQIIQFDEIKIDLLQELETCSDNMVNQLKILIKDLKLKQQHNSQQNKQEQEQEKQKVEELYKQGYKLYWDSKYKEAIKLFDAALFINTKHLDSLNYKARSLYYLDNYNDAIIWADKALSIDSKHIDSLNYKAQCLFYLSNYNDAIIWADKALSIDSKHIDSLYYKGNCNDAIIWADKALSIDSKHLNSLQTKCNYSFLIWVNHYTKWIIDQALNCKPNNCYSLYLRGKCLQSLQRYSEAIIYYEKSIQIDPNFSPSKNGKAKCEKLINKQQ
ncbi:unnamed protein product [Paramecium primaurelia]|uniref:Tetratricopeptide repeat protein n=1 Tax=Paramecium primaurelia TaxID=5886 RepID=A0A8S1NUJ3_PARPR|nr:unnamed protein product [Paramecium primaurelia]